MAIMKDFLATDRYHRHRADRRRDDVATSRGRAGSERKENEESVHDLKTFVFSKTLTPGEADGVTITGEDPGEFVRELKNRDGKDICIMGGGELAKRSLMPASLMRSDSISIRFCLAPAFRCFTECLGK